jgi:hypothetical protein
MIESVLDVKALKEARERSMQEGLREGKLEGKREGMLQAKREDLIQILTAKNLAEETILSRVKTEQDIETLSRWIIAAATATNTNELQAMMMQ